MHWQDILIALPLAAVLVWAIVHAIRRRNGTCCGGGDCARCRQAHPSFGKTSPSTPDRHDKEDEK